MIMSDNCGECSKKRVGVWLTHFFSDPFSFPNDISDHIVSTFPVLYAVVDPAVYLPKDRIHMTGISVPQPGITHVVPLSVNQFRMGNIDIWSNAQGRL